MKSRVIYFTVIHLMAALGVLWILQISSAAILPGYETQAMEEFGTPAGVKELADLYSKIEAAPDDAALKEIHEPLVASYPKVREIPRSWLPQSLSSKWGNDMGMWRRVLAYYGEGDRLAGIEFFGSRYGCFISRNATRCPPWYSSLRRIAEKPVHVTVRFSTE